MADYFPAEIHIGGPVPRRVLGKLIKSIAATGASLGGYEEVAATEELLRKTVQEGEFVDLYDDRARYGQFSELEEFLIRRRIHFNRHSEACYEYDAENAYYRGGKDTLILPASQSGAILIRFEDIMKILNNHDLDDHGRLEALIQLVMPPETKPLDPIRFV